MPRHHAKPCLTIFLATLPPSLRAKVQAGVRFPTCSAADGGRISRATLGALNPGTPFSVFNVSWWSGTWTLGTTATRGTQEFAGRAGRRRRSSRRVFARGSVEKYASALRRKGTCRSVVNFVQMLRELAFITSETRQHSCAKIRVFGANSHKHWI